MLEATKTFHSTAAVRIPASSFCVIHFPTFNFCYIHYHLQVDTFLGDRHFQCVRVCAFLSFFIPFSLFATFLFVFLFVLLTSTQAPLPPHLRARLCLRPPIGQSVPTLARSVFHPRRWTTEVHGLSILPFPITFQ